MPARLNKFLASAGLGSRRSCEKLILSGVVTINGRTIISLATLVTENDEVRVAGRTIEPPKTKTSIAFHKPKGFLCTKSDERSRRSIYELLPPHLLRLNHVGRLDKDSEGLLILTDDGSLAHHITHPSQKIPKEYLVELDSPIDEKAAMKLLRGFPIIGGFGSFDRIVHLGNSRYKVILSQGIKRQIRLMFYRVRRDVLRLKRIRIGSIELGQLKPGEWRPLRKTEITGLRHHPEKSSPTSPPMKIQNQMHQPL